METTIPVHIIAGFLGSGKTTLMNRLLAKRPPDLRPAIIVNDFGEIALDGDLIEHSEYALKELASGCVCCTLKGPLSDTLAVFVEEEDPDVILIETTGVAIPAELGSLFHSEKLEPWVHLGNVVCVVDAKSFLKYEPHFTILKKQVQQANTIVLNKVDLVTPEQYTATRNRLEYLSQPDAHIVETKHCQLDAHIIFEKRPQYFPAFLEIPHTHPHEEFTSFAFETDQVIALDKLENFLKISSPKLVRAKGIVQTDQGPKLVQVTLSGYTLSDWNSATTQSRFVFIGKDLAPTDINTEQLYT